MRRSPGGDNYKATAAVGWDTPASLPSNAGRRGKVVISEEVNKELPLSQLVLLLLLIVKARAEFIT